MVLCPLCEHAQAVGATCDGCGKSLVEQGAPTEAVAPLEGLESTRFDPIDATLPAEAPMAQLAGHRAPAVEIAASASLDVEATRFAWVRAFGPTPMLELERTRFEDESARTPVSSVVACRYCGNRQTEGALCDRCGMQLPHFARHLGSAASSEADIRCQICGVKGALSQRCRSCGAVILAAEPRAQVP